MSHTCIYELPDGTNAELVRNIPYLVQIRNKNNGRLIKEKSFHSLKRAINYLERSLQGKEIPWDVIHKSS